MFKRLLAMLLTLMLCVGMLPGTMMTASAATCTGTTGDCTWIFDDSTGVLTISGTGAMANYSGSNNPPWASYKDNIQTIVINEGVTSIGSNAFSQHSSLTKVFIPGSVEAIGNNAFYSCTSLSTVEYWGITAPTASSNAFSNTTSLLFVKVPNGHNSRIIGGVMARTSLGSIDSNTTYDINISASPAAGGTVTGAGEYHAGKVAITAAAKPGYRFVEWRESDAQISTDSTYILNVNSNHTIVAVFEEETAAPTTYAVYIDSDITGGTVTADKDEAAAGETVTLTVTPDDGYELDVLSVTDKDGGDVPVTDGVFTMPGSNVNVTATFKKTAAAFSIKLDAVDASEGIHLPGVNMVVTIGDDMKIASFSSSDGVYTLSGLAPNTTYTLSSQSEPSIFLWPKPVSFSFSDDGAIRTAGALTEDGTLLLMLEPACVSVKCIDSETGNAVQEFIPVEIKNSTGTVILAPTLCDLSTLTYLPTGEMLTLHVTDAGEYELPEDILFVIDQVGYVNTSASIDENGVILIQLKKKTPTYTVTVKPSDHGAATVSPATFTEGGSTISVNVVPNEGYVIKEVNPYTTDGTSLGTASRDATDPNKFTFVAPACDVTVELVFEAEAKTYTVTLLPSTNGTVTADRTTGLKEGDKVTLTFAPAIGYCPITLNVGGREVSSEALADRFTFFMPGRDISVSATFGPIKLLLEVGDENHDINSYATATVNGIVINTESATAFPMAPGEYTGIVDNPPHGYKQSSPFTLCIDEYNFLYSNNVTTSHEAEGLVIVSVTLEKDPVLSVTLSQGNNGVLSASKTAGLMPGEEVTLSVTPDSGCRLSALYVNDQDVTASVIDGKYTFTMPDGDVAATAAFEPITASSRLQLKTTDAEGNAFSLYTYVQFGVLVENNDVAAFTMNVGDYTGTIIPPYGYKAAPESITFTLHEDGSITSDDVTVELVDGVYFLPVTVTEYLPYLVEVVPAPYGTVTADKHVAAEGETVTLTVTPEEGYKLDTLSVKQGDTDVPVTDNQFTMPAGPVKVNATFKSTSYRFNMQLKLVDPDGNALSVYGTAYLEGSGTVHTSEAMIRTLSEGSHTLAFSFSITGYVNPEDAVLNVDADGNLTSGSSHVAIQKDGDVYYVVVTPAKVAAYPITANVTGSGTAEITRNGSAITEAVEGAYVLVYVTPDEDSQLYRVLFNDTDITGQFTQDGLGFRYVFPMPDEAVTLDVVFIDIYHVTFDANGGEGTMSPQDFVYGESQHLAKNTFTRNGYTFIGWSLNPNGTTPDAGDEMSVLVYADLTLYAVWKPAEPSDALPPDILTPAEPMTVTVREGETAKFSVQAVNAETYQWFVDYNDGTGWHIISAGSDTCTTAPTRASDNGNRYICVVTGEDDQMAESPVFTLEVLPKIVVPETGDSFQLGLWLALSCISGAGMMALKLSRRNRKNR